MSVTVKDWDNDSDNCKNLGPHNSKYRDAVNVINIDWYKYYIYPRTKNNVRTTAFEFFPYYEDSSGGRMPMDVIVDNYLDLMYKTTNAVTYPLEFNKTKDRFPEGWGIRDFNECKKIDTVKYKRHTAIYGDCDFYPVVLEPGTVVYGNESYLDKIEYAGAGTIDIEYFEDSLIITINKGKSSEEIHPYHRTHFMDNASPKRLLVEIQAAGGGGGGAEYEGLFVSRKGGGGAGSGAYAAAVINLIDYPSWRITLGGAGTGGRQWEDGNDANDSTLAKWESHYSVWSTVITCGGGKHGWGGRSDDSSNTHRGEGGQFSQSGTAGYWLMASQNGHYGGRSAGHEGDGGHGEAGESSVAVNYNTYVNDNLLGGSSMSYPVHKSYYGDSQKKWGGGGASVFASNNIDGGPNPAGIGCGGNGGMFITQGGSQMGSQGGKPKCIIYLPKKI